MELFDACIKNDNDLITSYVKKKYKPTIECFYEVCNNVNRSVFYLFIKIIDPDKKCVTCLCNNLTEENSKTILTLIKKIFSYNITPSTDDIKIILKKNIDTQIIENIIRLFFIQKVGFDLECTKLLLQYNYILSNLITYATKFDDECIKLLANKSDITLSLKSTIFEHFIKYNYQVTRNTLSIVCNGKNNERLIRKVIDICIKNKIPLIHPDIDIDDGDFDHACSFTGNLEGIHKMLEIGAQPCYNNFINICQYKDISLLYKFLDNDIIPDLNSLKIICSNPFNYDEYEKIIIHIIDKYKINIDEECFKIITKWCNNTYNLVNKFINIIPITYEYLDCKNEEIKKLLFSKIDQNKYDLLKEAYNDQNINNGIENFIFLTEQNIVPSLELIEYIFELYKNTQFIDIIIKNKYKLSIKCLQELCKHSANETRISILIQNGIQPDLRCLINATSTKGNGFVIFQLLKLPIDNIVQINFTIDVDYKIYNLQNNIGITPNLQCLKNICMNSDYDFIIDKMMNIVKPDIECLKILCKYHYKEVLVKKMVDLL